MMFLNGSGRNEHNRSREPFIDASYTVLIHFGQAVLIEKIQMWQIIKQKTESKWWQNLALPLDSWAKTVSIALFFCDPTP